MTDADTMSQDKWLQELFASIDDRNSSDFASFLTPDAVFCFGSAPAVKGRDEISAAVDRFFSTISGLSHRLDKIFRQGDSIAVEGQVTYTRHDQTSVTVPFVDVFDMAGQQVAGYKIYIDISPLYNA